MSRRLDGYLSTQVQLVYPDALVYCLKEGDMETWTMERKGQEPLGLGTDFKQAKVAILALRNAHIVATGRRINAEREGEGK